MIFDKTAVTALDVAAQLPDLLRSVNSDSLVEYNKTTRVEPIVLMDQRAAFLPGTPDLLQSLTSIFSGYYLQAVAISVNVGKVDVTKLLDKLNPNRSPMENAGSVAGVLLSQESYQHGLPFPGQRIGLEAFFKPNEEFERNEPTEQGFGRDTVTKLQDLSNLSVGKMLEVHIESEGHRATIPVSVRLMVTGIDSDALVHTLSVDSKDTSVKERWHAWRSGQLKFIRDLVFCQDLIDEHRQALMKDRTGIYAATLKRRNKNRLSAVLSGNPSVATASNIVVMTNQTATQLERAVGGRLKDFRTREKIFKVTYCMLMVVYDSEWEMVTIYHRSIDTPTKLSVKDLKSAARGTGPDVSEILKAYQLGQSPSI